MKSNLQTLCVEAALRREYNRIITLTPRKVSHSGSSQKIGWFHLMTSWRVDGMMDILRDDLTSLSRPKTDMILHLLVMKKGVTLWWGSVSTIRISHLSHWRTERRNFFFVESIKLSLNNLEERIHPCLVHLRWWYSTLFIPITNDWGSKAKVPKKDEIWLVVSNLLSNTSSTSKSNRRLNSNFRDFLYVVILNEEKEAVES